MNLGELRAAFRSRADDLVIPYLWADDEVDRFINEAQVEACVRARLIFDADSSFLLVPIVAGQGEYTLDPSIVQIAYARVDGYGGTTAPGYQLDGTDQSVLDRDQWFKWWSQSSRPRYFMQDGRTIRLAPIPDSSGTLALAVYRIPTDSEWMDADSDDPVIPGHWHMRMLDWALYLAFSKNDVDTVSQQRAQLAEQRFESSFGKRIDANTERKRQERRSHVSQVNWPRSYSRPVRYGRNNAYPWPTS